MTSPFEVPEEPPVAALDALRHPVPVDEPAADDARRLAAIDRTRAAIRREASTLGRRGRFGGAVFALLGAAAAAAAFAAWSFVPHGHTVVAASTGRAPLSALAAPAQLPSGATLRVTSGVVVAVHDGVPIAVPAGEDARLAEGDELTTALDATALVLLPRGVRVELGRASKAWVTAARELEQRIRLDVGRTSVSVPRPGGPRVFAVETPDSEVVVHGTEFVVDVDRARPGDATHTSVSVSRGSVLVRHDGSERLLAPGDRWSSADAASPASPVAVEARAAKAEAPSRELRGELAATATKASLAEQNRLFQLALEARRAGDDARVVASLDDLLGRFPDTALAQEARLARFRALDRMGRTTDAAREARRYLASHPDSPAREEARRLVLESATGSSGK